MTQESRDARTLGKMPDAFLISIDSLLFQNACFQHDGKARGSKVAWGNQ